MTFFKIIWTLALLSILAVFGLVGFTFYKLGPKMYETTGKALDVAPKALDLFEKKLDEFDDSD